MAQVPLDVVPAVSKKPRPADYKFPDIVKMLSGHDVIPTPSDHPVLRLLASELDLLLGKQTYTAYTAKRVNEVGSQLEKEIRDIVSRGGSLQAMPRQGYPDMLVEFPGHESVYIEVKTTTKAPDEKSSFRAFYLSTGKKITRCASHVLVRLFLEQVSSTGMQSMFKLASWEVQDLHCLRLRLKKEYNASPNDMSQLPTLFSNSASLNMPSRAAR